MIGICESYLEQYPTTLEEDEILIYDKKLFNAFTRQERMAIKLRSSEKRILKQTIKAISDELEKLPALITNEEGGSDSTSTTIATAGRSFDTMKAKMTVTKAKSLSDWVDIKGEKPKKTNDVKQGFSNNNSNNGDNANDNKGKSSIAERRRKRRGE
eukprot:gene12465-16719_t